jgi:hypothetical protein
VAWKKIAHLRAQQGPYRSRIAPREPRIRTRRFCRRRLPVPPEALVQGPPPLPPAFRN